MKGLRQVRRGRQAFQSAGAAGASRFRLAIARARGRRHERDNQPCQDAVVRLQSGARACIVLCDGAGSARWSDTGARVCAEQTAALLMQGFRHWHDDLDTRHHVVAALRRRLRQVASRRSCKLRDLACTLLFAATDGRQVLLGQLGDGRIAIRRTAGAQWQVLDTSTKGQYLNETLFVTSREAIKHLNVVRLPATDVTGAVLMSDGAEECLYNRLDQRLAPAVETMAGWLRHHDPSRVEAALTAQLSGVLRSRTFDDLSLALMVR